MAELHDGQVLEQRRGGDCSRDCSYDPQDNGRHGSSRAYTPTRSYMRTTQRGGAEHVTVHCGYAPSVNEWACRTCWGCASRSRRSVWDAPPRVCCSWEWNAPSAMIRLYCSPLSMLRCALRCSSFFLMPPIGRPNGHWGRTLTEVRAAWTTHAPQVLKTETVFASNDMRMVIDVKTPAVNMPVLVTNFKFRGKTPSPFRALLLRHPHPVMDHMLHVTLSMSLTMLYSSCAH